jgi:peptidoglycan-associated lipoprotein
MTRKFSLILISAAAILALSACSKKEPPAVNPTVKDAPAATAKSVGSSSSAMSAEDSAAVAQKLAAEKLERDRAHLEEMINKIMEDEVYFDFDRSELTESARELLTEVGSMLIKEPRFVITVGGHTDARGTEDYNMVLGSKRAQKVKEFLVAYGVKADRLETISYGKEQPKVEGQTEEAYAQNRRANFKVTISKK